jgi:predicted anti-sigma-YlaC factor YlaD
MELSDDQIRTLVRALSITREQEIDCGECLNMVAEFAERELAGRPIPVALETVRHHLTRCGECREEYEAMFAALKRMQEQQEQEDSEGRPE